MKKQINLSPQSSEGQAYDNPSVNDSRKFKITRKSLEGVVASLEILGDQIQLKVSQEDFAELDGKVGTLESNLTIQAGLIASKVSFTDLNETLELYSTIEQTATQIASRVSFTDLSTQLANYSTITQTATQIATRVSTTDYTGATIASLINQTSKSISLSALNIDLSGFITFSNLSTAGQTTINGNNITTGTVNADRISVNSLNINKLQTGTSIGGAGMIAFNSGNITLYGSSINDASLNFNNGGNVVRIYNAGSNMVGISGILYLASSLQVNGQTTSKSILPASNNTYSLGTGSFRWSTIYQTNGAVTGSDKVLKKDIEDIVEATNLVKLLKPRRYKMKDGSSNRPHYGYIAQEVKQALDELGLDSGVYIDPVVKEIPENGAGYAKGLRYEEFIALNTAVIQHLLNRVEDLEHENSQRNLQTLAA